MNEIVNVLETVMLVCFGLSWPINVIKNVRARSAKGMSLPFILLIITGYVAGISAKVVNGQFNYVFAVYIMNILFVMTNLVIYFRNRAIDKQTELAGANAEVIHFEAEKRKERESININHNTPIPMRSELKKVSGKDK